MNRTKLVEIGGWVGVGAILGAYGLVSFGRIGSGDAVYQLLNVVGSLLVVIQAASVRNYQPMVLNIVWATIALTALVKLFFFS